MIEIADYEIIRIFVAISMLGLASFLDLRKREISDMLWICYGIIAGVLLLFDPNFFKEITIVGFSLIISPLALLAWRLGLFGGADAFALIVLAGISPMATIFGNTVTPFTTLTNAAILFLVPLLINMLRNIRSILKKDNIFEGFDESTIKKICAMFIGYKAKNSKFSFAIEKFNGIHKKFDLSLHNAETAEFCTTQNTWVTPGIPYLLLITAGYVIQLLYGDILIKLFTS